MEVRVVVPQVFPHQEKKGSSVVFTYARGLIFAPYPKEGSSLLGKV